MDRRKILLVVAVVVAAIGAGLVFVYAQGAEDRAAEKLQTREVLVAQQIILPGESASDAANAGKLVRKFVPEAEILDGSTLDGNDFADTVALTTIYPGEQVLIQKFGAIGDVEGAQTLALPAGKSAITLELTDAGRVGSFTQPGSHVAVYFTPVVDETLLPDGTAEPANSALVVPACVLEDDLLVLGVGSQTINPAPTPEGEEPSTDTVAVTNLTVAVDSEQASSLIGFQTSETTLTFALRNSESVIRNTKACVEYLRAFNDSLELAGPNPQTTNG